MAKEEKWYQKPLGSGVISGIVTGLVVGVFLIFIVNWTQENAIPSIILLNYTAKNTNIDVPNSNLNIDVNILISNPSSRSIVIEDVIINVEVNGSWREREGGGAYYETIIRNGEQIISSTRNNYFGAIPSGKHKVRVIVLYYDGKSTKSLYGYFNNLNIESGIPFEAPLFEKIKLTDKLE
ncbi:MAG: hypothetical protein WAW23_10245 [Candidatus Methanoperedens sp.]